MNKQVTLCRHNINAIHCQPCQAERKRKFAIASEKEHKRKEWEAKHPNKHANARKVLGLQP